LPEFGKLIEEENASMAEAYLPRPGPAAATDQPNECIKCGTLAIKPFSSLQQKRGSRMLQAICAA
jgi:hypothetical protein